MMSAPAQLASSVPLFQSNVKPRKVAGTSALGFNGKFFGAIHQKTLFCLDL